MEIRESVARAKESVLTCRPRAIIILRDFLIISLLTISVAAAQLSRGTIAQLPDSLRPVNPDKISYIEAERILMNSWYQDLPLERYRTDLDLLCIDFTRRYRRFRTKTAELKHCHTIHVYWKTRVTTDQNLIPVFLDSAKKYNSRYRAIIGTDSAKYKMEFGVYLKQKGLILFSERQFSEAYTYFVRAAELFRQLDSNRNLARIYQLIAQMRGHMHQFEEAISAVDSAMVALKKSRSPGKTDPEYLRYGQILSFKKAELYGFLFCGTRRKEFYDSTLKAMNLYWKVDGQQIYNRRNKYLTSMRISYYSGNYKASIAYADSFLLIKTKEYPDLVWMNCYVYKALSLDKLGKVFEQGKWLSLRGLQADNPDYRYLLRELYLSERKKGNFGVALRYQARLIEYKDSLDLINHSRKIEILQKGYDRKLVEMKINTLQERETRNRIYFGLAAMIIGLLLVIVAMGYFNRLKKTKELISRIEEMTLLHIIRIEDEKQTQRTRMGQELHDNLAGVIAASVRISQKLAEDSEDKKVKSELLSLSKLLGDGYDRARNHSHDLYIDKTTEDFWKNMSQDIELFFFGSKIVVEFQNFISNIALSSETKTILLLTLREAITNIIKHAMATKVEILLYEELDNVVLEISDNGRGIKNVTMKTIGLRSMLDRITGVNGNLTVLSKKGSGVNIKAQIPINIKTSQSESTQDPT